MEDERSFLFSANPLLQRRSFSSIGLISNAHRVERSTNFLIMKKRKYGEKTKGNIELRNIEAGVLQVLFGMLHLMGETLLTEISRLQFCKKDKKNCTLHIKVVYLPTV